MFDLKSEEILTYLLLIIVGYYIAKMFSRRCNGFSVGGQGTRSTNDHCINNLAQGLADLGNANINEYNLYCSNNGCYYSNKNSEHTCRSCESIDLSTIIDQNKEQYCSGLGALATGGACHYDSSRDICVSNLKTCESFDSDACPLEKSYNYQGNKCVSDCTINDCCVNSGFLNNQGFCLQRSDISVSEDMKVKCEDLSTLGECVGRMGELYNRFNTPRNDNALYQCQWYNNYGTRYVTGQLSDYEITNTIGAHYH